MSWCEEHGVWYCFGLARNDRLSELLNGNFESLKAQINEGKIQSPCRRVFSTWCTSGWAPWPPQLKTYPESESNRPSLTRAQFEQLADIPLEEQWLANITNLKTRRAYKEDVRKSLESCAVYLRNNLGQQAFQRI
jgi:hypothetical protein